MLEVSGLGRTYGTGPRAVTALDGVDLTVDRGEMVAIMGPSGSGKSTLLMITGGLEAPTAGSVRLDSQQLEHLKPGELAEVRRRRIGFVFQSFNLLTGLTALENVAAPLELDGVPAGRARQEAQAQLDAVGLGERGDAFPSELSGGEQQRVAIARGLVGDRQLLLADEPTGALDSENGDRIIALLREACTPERAVVVVTHDATVAAWSDRVVNLQDGRVVGGYRPGARS